MVVLRVGASAQPSAARTYHELRERRICDLLGAWVSELEPMIFERVDVSPQVLLEVGIGGPGDVAPLMSAQVTVAQIIAAGAIG